MTVVVWVTPVFRGTPRATMLATYWPRDVQVVESAQPGAQSMQSSILDFAELVGLVLEEGRYSVDSAQFVEPVESVVSAV